MKQKELEITSRPANEGGACSVANSHQQKIPNFRRERKQSGENGHSFDLTCCIRKVISREAGTQGLNVVLSLRYETNFPSL